MIQQTHSITMLETQAKLFEPIVMCAADDHYVRPLAVMLRSAAEHLGVGKQLSVIVLDGGISEAHWVGLKETLADLPITIYPISPDLDEVTELSISHHITHTAYLRLLAGRVLPPFIDKVIYLDADVLVCDDLSQLWDLPLNGQYALAVQDMACPFVDARHADCNYAKSSPYLAALSPIPNWRELGLQAGAPYFNSGVMVLNVRRMRDENLEQKLLRCLQDNHQHVWCWDQYALNVVFSEQWMALPARWNQGAIVFEFPDENHSPVAKAEFLSARDNPAIIHYTTEWKPWHYDNRHPQREQFFRQLDKTVWRGWRPEKPKFSLTSSWKKWATLGVKHSVIQYRKLTTSLTQGAAAVPVGASAAEPTRITIFSMPKAFVGIANESQRNAINSWKRLGAHVDIILVGDEAGIAEIAQELGVGHVPDVRKNEHGTPLIGSAFARVRESSDSPIFAYCNSDVILFSSFVQSLQRLIAAPELNDFLAIGRRTDMQLDRLVDFESDAAVAALEEEGRRHGCKDSIVCKEFFAFPRHLFEEVPDFAVGRGNWDNWMVHHAKSQEIPVVSISDCAMVLHQRHGYQHVSGNRLDCYVRGDEAKSNQKLAAGRHLISGSTCTWRLTPLGLRRSRMRFVNGEFWVDFPKFAGLLLDFMGRR